VIHLVGIPLTGTSVNPARSIGPALFAGGTPLAQLWLFIVAPLVGAVIAAGAHRALGHGPDGAREDPTSAAGAAEAAGRAEAA
jgi:aquaporin Z